MKPQHITLCTCLALSSFFSIAQDTMLPFGASQTRGYVSHSSDPASSLNNPAAASHMLKGDGGFSANFIAPFGGGYEVGKIDSLIDELDELIDILEDEDLSAEEALDAKDRFEPFLENAERDGMVKLTGSAVMPFFPLFYHSNDLGTFTLDLSFAGSLRSTVLADDIDIVAFNNSFKINTSASAYVKSAGLVTAALGYSRPVWKYDSGLVHMGVKARFNRYHLSKNVISFAGLEDGEDIGDAIKDDYENNANTASNVGVDVGLLWADKNFTLGLVINDINAPVYEYGSLASSCSDMTGISLDNCVVAQDAIASGRIAADEEYKANTQARLEASTWLGEETKFGFTSSIDLNDKNDAIGDIYQWANVSAVAQLENWLLPEFRIGYSKNLAGSELSYYSVGITFFKHADLDLRFSDESVEIDDSKAPRSAFFSFSIQTRF